MVCSAIYVLVTASSCGVTHMLFAVITYLSPCTDGLPCTQFVRARKAMNRIALRPTQDMCRWSLPVLQLAVLDCRTKMIYLRWV